MRTNDRTVGFALTQSVFYLEFHNNIALIDSPCTYNNYSGKVYQLCSLAMKDPVKPAIVEDMTIKVL